MNELINHKGVCRTAPATPGLLKTFGAKPHRLYPGWPIVRGGCCWGAAEGIAGGALAAHLYGGVLEGVPIDRAGRIGVRLVLEGGGCALGALPVGLGLLFLLLHLVLVLEGGSKALRALQRDGVLLRRIGGGLVWGLPVLLGDWLLPCGKSISVGRRSALVLSGGRLCVLPSLVCG